MVIVDTVKQMPVGSTPSEMESGQWLYWIERCFGDIQNYTAVMVVDAMDYGWLTRKQLMQRMQDGLRGKCNILQ